jgi:hypothetical protein
VTATAALGRGLVNILPLTGHQPGRLQASQDWIDAPCRQAGFAADLQAVVRTFRIIQESAQDL